MVGVAILRICSWISIECKLLSLPSPNRPSKRNQYNEKNSPGPQRLFRLPQGHSCQGFATVQKKKSGIRPFEFMFLLNRSFVLAWTMSVFILLRSYPLSLWPDDFESPKDRVFRRFFEVSSREWIILFYLSFGCWLEPYCLLNSAHSLASIIAVTCGDEPKNWRPLFGDIADAYTVGRFFGSVYVLYANKCLISLTSG